MKACPFCSGFREHVPNQTFTLAIKIEERTVLTAFAHTKQGLFWSSYVFPFLFLVIALSLLALENNWAVISNIFSI